MRSMITIVIESKEGVGQNDYFLGPNGDESIKELVRVWTERSRITELHTYDEREVRQD